MRDRDEIAKDVLAASTDLTIWQSAMLSVLLDIRELLMREPSARIADLFAEDEEE